MTLRTAFELGQFANRLKDHGADSLYDDFMKIVDMLMNEPKETINIPDVWTTTDPLMPKYSPDPTCEATCKASEPIVSGKIVDRYL